jgi:hypothetical protein
MHAIELHGEVNIPNLSFYQSIVDMVWMSQICRAHGSFHEMQLIGHLPKRKLEDLLTPSWM